MMKEFKCYTLICDNCGIDLNDGEPISGWTELDTTLGIALECNWYLDDVNEKDYCNDCFSYDDEDELIINESRKDINKTT